MVVAGPRLCSLPLAMAHMFWHLPSSCWSMRAPVLAAGQVGGQEVKVGMLSTMLKGLRSGVAARNGQLLGWFCHDAVYMCSMFGHSNCSISSRPEKTHLFQQDISHSAVRLGCAMQLGKPAMTACCPTLLSLQRFERF